METNSYKNILNMLKKYPPILTFQEAKEVLRIGDNSLGTLLKEEKILAKKLKRKWFIPKESVIQYILKGK